MRSLFDCTRGARRGGEVARRVRYMSRAGSDGAGREDSAARAGLLAHCTALCGKEAPAVVIVTPDLLRSAD